MLHPDGSTFQVAKGAVGDDMVEHIKKTVPLHMYDGGNVPGVDPTIGVLPQEKTIEDIYRSASTAAPIAEKPKSQLAIPGFMGNEENAIKLASDIDTLRNGGKLEKQASQPEPAAIPAVNLDKPTPEIPIPTISTKTDLTRFSPIKTADIEADAIRKKGQAESDAAKANANAWDAYNLNQKIQAEQDDATRANFLKKSQDFENAYKSGKLDPNRVWNNMSTGNKVLASVGLFLGGLGAGSGGTNRALQTINKTIDDDIDAQKTEILKNKDLLLNNQHNMKEFQEWAATKKVDQLNAVKSMVEANAAKSGSVVAQKNAEIAVQNLNREIGKTIETHLTQQAALRNADPLTVRIETVLPEKERDDARKEMASYSNNRNAIAEADDIFSKLGKIQTLANRVGDPRGSAHEVQAQNGRMLNVLLKGIDTTKMSDALIENLAKPFHIEVLDTPKEVLKKQEAFKDMLRLRASPTPILTGRGWLPDSTKKVKFTSAK